MDLDASCFIFDDNNNPIDLVYFGQLASRDGSVQHSGDNRTGEGDGDDEQIAVALNRIPANVKTLVFTVSNYTGQNFSQLENAYCRLVDGQTGKEIARYDLSAQGNHTAQIMAKVYRANLQFKCNSYKKDIHKRYCKKQQNIAGDRKWMPTVILRQLNEVA
nr:TerD family protein [Cardiobacterium hominis]